MKCNYPVVVPLPLTTGEEEILSSVAPPVVAADVQSRHVAVQSRYSRGLLPLPFSLGLFSILGQIPLFLVLLIRVLIQSRIVGKELARVPAQEDVSSNRGKSRHSRHVQTCPQIFQHWLASA
jgi:hypothetical protein